MLVWLTRALQLPILQEIHANTQRKITKLFLKLMKHPKKDDTIKVQICPD